MTEKILCRFCRSKRTAKRGFRYNIGSKKQLYFCLDCRKKFTQDDGFLKARYSKSAIVMAVRLYRKGKSSSEVRDELKRNNINVSRWTIIKWNKKYNIPIS